MTTSDQNSWFKWKHSDPGFLRGLDQKWWITLWLLVNHCSNLHRRMWLLLTLEEYLALNLLGHLCVNQNAQGLHILLSLCTNKNYSKCFKMQACQQMSWQTQTTNLWRKSKRILNRKQLVTSYQNLSIRSKQKQNHFINQV